MNLKNFKDFINGDRCDLGTIMPIEEYLEEFRRILSSDDGIRILVGEYDKHIEDLKPHMNATHMLRNRMHCEEFLNTVKKLKVVNSYKNERESSSGIDLKEEVTIYEADKGRIAVFYLNDDTGIPSHVFMDEDFLSSNFLISIKGVDKYSL